MGVKGKKSRQWTEEERRAALWRVYTEIGSISKSIYLGCRRDDEPGAEGMIWRAGGWNALMARHGLPVTPQGGAHRGALAPSKANRRKPRFKPIEKPKRRLCLKCREPFVCVNFTCPRCRKVNQGFVEDFACL